MTLTGSIGSGLAWFLAWLFVRGLCHKLLAPGYYRQLMTNYIGIRGGGMAVWLIAGLETGIVLTLLLPRWRSTGLAVAAALLLVYAGLMTNQILAGRAGMQCGCSGPDSPLEISWALVVRNGLCAGLALLAMFTAGAGATGWSGIGVAGLIAIFSALVYLASDMIISHAQWMAGEG